MATSCASSARCRGAAGPPFAAPFKPIGAAKAPQAARIAERAQKAAALAQAGLTPQPLRRNVAARAATLERAGSSAGGAPTGPVLVAVAVPECRLAFGENLKIVGAPAELGGWDAAAAPALQWGEGDNWSAALELPAGEHLCKLVIVRPDGSQQWEEGGDRRLAVAAGLAAPPGVPALKATCRFGDTGATAVEASVEVAAPKAGAAAAAPAGQHTGMADALPSTAQAAEAAGPQKSAAAQLQAAAEGAAAAGSGPAVRTAEAAAKAAAAKQALAGSAGLSSGDSEDEAQQQQQTAEELAAAWRQSRQVKKSKWDAAAMSAEPTKPAAPAVPAAPARAAPAAAAAAKPAKPASQRAAAAAGQPSAGLPLALALAPAAAAVAVGAVSLGLLPEPTGLGFDLPRFDLGAAQQAAAAGFAAWTAGVGAGLAPLQAQGAQALSAGLAGLQAGSAEALAGLGASSADTLAAFQASGAEVLSNVRDNSASLQAAVQAQGAGALAALQQQSADAVAAAQASLSGLSLPQQQ